MRTNRAFERLAGGAADVPLEPRLRGIVTSPVVERQDCLFWSALVPDGALPTAGLDETGLEALVNKVHVDDFVAPPALVAQSLAALQLAAASLQGHGPLCLVLSLHLEQPTAVLRFFRRREHPPWLSESLEDYAHEALAVIDVPA